MTSTYQHLEERRAATGSKEVIAVGAKESTSSDNDLVPLYEGVNRAALARSRRLRNLLGGAFIILVSLALISVVLVLAVSYAKGKDVEDDDGDVSVDGGSAAEGAASKGNPGGLPVAQVHCGTVEGVLEKGVSVFKGMPYAVSPTGRAGRWSPPQDLEEDTCWEEPYPANQFGTPCCQEGEVNEECEDCLYINVWTPKLERGAKLDVMVYIHGGGLVVGSGNTPGSMPTPELASTSNMVYVSFNYRLNVFGFLALEELAEIPRFPGEDPRKAAGNYGFMDQVLALKWVKQNIESFGGNPDQVTLFGADSGATSIMALLSTNATQGLIHRAWLMSPSPRFNASLDEAQKQNKQGFLSRSSCTSDGLAGREMLDCLLGLSPMDMIKAAQIKDWHNPQFWTLPEPDETSTLIAIVDGSLLQNAPHVSWKSGVINHVPLLIGNTAQEVSDNPQPRGVEMWNSTAYEKYVRSKLGRLQFSLGDEALKNYPIVTADGTKMMPEKQLTSMVTDMRTICGTDEKFKVFAQFSSAPVYRYVVQDLNGEDSGDVQAVRTNDDDDMHRFAFRGLDEAVFFDAIEAHDMKRTEKVSSFQRELRDTVFGFVRGGRIDHWDEFPGYTALFNQRSTKAYHEQQCLFWRRNAMFPNYAWIN